MADNTSAREVQGRDAEGHGGIDRKRLGQFDAEAASGRIAAAAIAVAQFSGGAVPGDLHVPYQSMPLMKAAGDLLVAYQFVPLVKALGAAPGQEHETRARRANTTRAISAARAGCPRVH